MTGTMERGSHEDRFLSVTRFQIVLGIMLLFCSLHDIFLIQNRLINSSSPTEYSVSMRNRLSVNWLLRLALKRWTRKRASSPLCTFALDIPLS